VERSQFRLHRGALVDLDNAVRGYAALNEQAALDFRGAVEEAIARIVEYPEAWPPHEHGTRRYVLRRFPYSIVYQTAGGMIRVVAVANARRQPGYWVDRLRDA
jgi:plasmid stabilization system protein ParE